MEPVVESEFGLRQEVIILNNIALSHLTSESSCDNHLTNKSPSCSYTAHLAATNTN